MTEHLTQNQIEEYGRQKLRAAELLSVSDHLAGCAACRRLVESALDADAAFFALRSELFDEAAEIPPSHAVRAHPTLEETAGYVDGTLAGEEMQVVADHLTRCEQCALSVDDLRAFRHQAAPALNREYYPAAVPAPNQNWWRRLVSFPPSSFPRSHALAFGSALAVLLLVATTWLIWQKLERRETKRETAATTPSPAGTSPAPVVTPTASSTPAAVIAQLDDGGGRLVLDQEGKLSGADYLRSDYRDMVKEVLTHHVLEKSLLLSGLSRPASSLMGTDNGGGEFSVIDPVGKALLADRPTFRWSPLDDATGYRVEVYDEKFNRVATSSRLTANSWTSPQSLRRGGIYSWQVKAIKDGQEFSSPRPPAPQAKFRILDQAKADELVEARRTYASSHLTLALLYAQAGLLDETEQELRLLQKANPNSELVPQLLANVQAMRR